MIQDREETSRTIKDILLTSENPSDRMLDFILRREKYYIKVLLTTLSTVALLLILIIAQLIYN